MNRITSLFGIRYPIIQGGMVWCSGWRLASAVSNAGGLGLLGAGSMHPETLREHIQKIGSIFHNVSIKSCNIGTACIHSYWPFTSCQDTVKLQKSPGGCSRPSASHCTKPYHLWIIGYRIPKREVILFIVFPFRDY